MRRYLISGPITLSPAGRCSSRSGILWPGATWWTGEGGAWRPGRGGPDNRTVGDLVLGGAQPVHHIAVDRHFGNDVAGIGQDPHLCPGFYRDAGCLQRERCVAADRKGCKDQLPQGEPV